MGMFSWDCNGCGFSLRDCSGCSEENWMGRGVVMTQDGSRVIGWYDGYGHLGEYNLVNQIGRFAVWHFACWELAGRPEYDRPACHSHDQGFCHAMHGHALPRPTSIEWLAKAKMWQSIDAVLRRYANLLCDLDHAREEGLWKSLSPERQLACCIEFEADREARKDRDRQAWTAYISDDDPPDYPPMKEEDPKHYKFDGVVFDYMWLGHFISMAKNDR